MQQYQNCPRCGAQNYYGERFCGSCGFNLIAPDQTPPPPPPIANQPQSPGNTQPGGFQPGGQPAPGSQPQQGYQQQLPFDNMPPQTSQGNAPQYQQNQPVYPPQGQPMNPPQMYQQGQPPHMPGQPIGWINPEFQQHPSTYGTYSAYGEQYKKKKTMNWMFILLIGLIVILFGVGGVGLATNGFNFESSTSSSSGSPSATVPAVAPTTTAEETTTENTTPEETTTPTSTTTVTGDVTATEIISEYTLDDVAAAGKYGGKTYDITGTISSYMAGASPPTATLKGEGEDEVIAIDCAFPEGTDITSLVIGETITIRGRFATTTLEQGENVKVTKCEIVE